MCSALTRLTQVVSLVEATGLPSDTGAMAARVEPKAVFVEAVCYHQINGWCMLRMRLSPPPWGPARKLAPETQEGVTTLKGIMDGLRRQFGRQRHNITDAEGSNVHVTGGMRAGAHNDGGGSMPSHTG